MKTCPYCGRSFPTDADRCPACRRPYWEESRDSRPDIPIFPEEEQGCLAMLLFHFLIAVGFAACLIALGFAINLLVHFEANQLKIVWIGASLLLGGLISFFLKILKKTRKGRRQKKR